MASIRKTKKILKNSKGFLTVITKNKPCVLPLNEDVDDFDINTVGKDFELTICF